MDPGWGFRVGDAGLGAEGGLDAAPDPAVSLAHSASTSLEVSHHVLPQQLAGSPSHGVSVSLRRPSDGRLLQPGHQCGGSGLAARAAHPRPHEAAASAA